MVQQVHAIGKFDNLVEEAQFQVGSSAGKGAETT